VLIVGCSTPKLRVDNKCLMAGPYTLAFIDISIAGTSSSCWRKRHFPPAWGITTF